MFILYLQNIALDSFILFIIVSFISGTTENPSQNEFTGRNEYCVKKFNGSGTHSLNISKDCHTYYMDFVFESTSIINLTCIQYPALQSTVSIILSELTTYIDKKEDKKVLLEEWHENNCTIPCVRNYLSRSSKVFIEISGTGNWSYSEIEFNFEEIPYRLIPLESEDKRQMALCTYNPNSVSLLRLPASSWRRIKIWFDNLTIDTEMGEYILIGSGTEPFANKHSRPMYVSKVKENTTFLVDDSAAFVAYVSGSAPNTQANKDFTIFWKGIGKHTDEVVEDPKSVLNSSLICFFNYSAALQELEKGKDKSFENFRQHFAETAKKYLKGEYENIDLNNRSVDLFGTPTKKDGLDILALLIKIMHKGKSIFTWAALQTIIKNSAEKGESVLGYKVDICPEQTQYKSPYEGRWDIVFYSLVPVFGLLALIIWAWRQKVFAQNCLTEKEEKLSFGHIHAEPNAYTTTTAKMRYEEGRTETLIQSSSQQEDTEGATDTEVVEMNTIPSTSKEPDTLTRYLSSKRSKSRPSIQSLLDNVEEINKQSYSAGKTGSNESDHLYDSVSSDKQLGETKL